MKIVHLATRLAFGGSERNMLASIRLEVEGGNEVFLLCGSVDNRARDAFSEYCNVVEVPSLRRAASLRYDPIALARICLALLWIRPTVVHTHQSKAGILGRLAALTVRPRPLIVHTVHMASFGPGYGRFEGGLWVLLERLSARWTDCLCFVGVELQEEYFKSRVRARTSRVLRTPIDVEHFFSCRGAVPASPPVIAVVGALERRKRQDLVITELADLVRARRAVLHFAGIGPEASSLKQLARELGIDSGVHFLGYLDDVAPLLRRASVLVHASTSEGVPQVIIQALAAGVPVVATDVEGLREIASAPILIASRGGSDLRILVESSLANGPPPVPAESVRLWAPGIVQKEYQEFLRYLANLHEVSHSRRGSASHTSRP